MSDGLFGVYCLLQLVNECVDNEEGQMAACKRWQQEGIAVIAG